MATTCENEKKLVLLKKTICRVNLRWVNLSWHARGSIHLSAWLQLGIYISNHGANAPENAIFVDSYLLRSVVDTFEHFPEWPFSDTFLFCEDEFWVDFLQWKKQITKF